MDTRTMEKLSALKDSIDWVAFDLDGTLLDSQGLLTDPVIRAVNALAQSSIKPMMITGRPRSVVLPLAAQLGMQYPLISSNGGMISDPVEGVLDSRNLTENDARRVLEMVCLRENVTVFCETGEQVLTNLGHAGHRDIELDPLTQRVELTVRDDLSGEDLRDVYKISMVGDPDRLREIRISLGELSHSFHIVETYPDLLEITHMQAEKGQALTRLAAMRGMDLDRLLAVGDGGNDLGMFAVAGFSAAMGNGAAEVREAADFILPCNDSDGTARLVWALLGGTP